MENVYTDRGLKTRDLPWRHTGKDEQADQSAGSQWHIPAEEVKTCHSQTLNKQDLFERLKHDIPQQNF